MKTFAKTALCALVLAVMAVACSERERLIPRNELSRIYAEMLIADAWLSSHPEAARTADTTAFYAPILNRRGYTADDYRYSVYTYMADPESFSKILKKSSSLIEKKLKNVNRYIEAISEFEAMLPMRVNLDADYMLYDTLYNELANPYAVDIRVDDKGRFIPHRVMPDTVYSGPEFTTKEELTARRDSVLKAREDSIALSLGKPIDVELKGESADRHKIERKRR